jgi:hypothetical protein
MIGSMLLLQRCSVVHRQSIRQVMIVGTTVDSIRCGSCVVVVGVVVDAA